MESDFKRGSLQRLLRNLTRELFQTEVSASRHCRREAKRLVDTPPSRAMLAVAEHADMVLNDLPPLANRHDLPVSRGGMATGALFSAVREHIADHLVEAERSYRGTLLGMRHGVDLVRLVRHVAAEQGDREIAAFCDNWLSIRVPLVARVEEQLVWFAQHSHRAMALARPLPLLGRARHA
jgi:hypothetical protein